MTEWEIWACAAMLRADYGELDASVHAAMHADKLLAAGDVVGYALWIRIMACIPKLSAVLEADDAAQ